MSVLLPLPKPETGREEREGGGVVEWRAPHIDWNPWSNRSGYLETSPYAQLEPVSVMSCGDHVMSWGSCDLQGERAARHSHDLAQEMSQRKSVDRAIQKVGCMCVCINL